MYLQYHRTPSTPLHTRCCHNCRVPAPRSLSPIQESVLVHPISIHVRHAPASETWRHQLTDVNEEGRREVEGLLHRVAGFGAVRYAVTRLRVTDAGPNDVVAGVLLPSGRSILDCAVTTSSAKSFGSDSDQLATDRGLTLYETSLESASPASPAWLDVRSRTDRVKPEGRPWRSCRKYRRCPHN
jgi:hypothetical protein